MTENVVSRLRAAGLTLPDPPKPAANYVPFVRSGSLLFIAGQTPTLAGKAQYVGVVGRDISVETAQLAAQVCALNVLSLVRLALDGDLDRAKCLRIGGFVRCGDDFTQQSLVLDGASNLLVMALGERGRHARTAVGVNALPRGVPVEIEAVFEV